MTPETKTKRVDIAERFDNRADDFARAADVQKALAASVRRATDEYIKTGITLVPRDVVFHGAIYQKPRSYFRALAAELGRPFVYAEELNRGDDIKMIELHVAQSDRLSDVVAGFLLVSKVVPNEPQHWHTPAHPIMRCDTGGTWRVWFSGKDGHEIFNHFVNKVRTDPVTRIILKLA